MRVVCLAQVGKVGVESSIVDYLSVDLGFDFPAEELAEDVAEEAVGAREQEVCEDGLVEAAGQYGARARRCQELPPEDLWDAVSTHHSSGSTVAAGATVCTALCATNGLLPS